MYQQGTWTLQNRQGVQCFKNDSPWVRLHLTKTRKLLSRLLQDLNSARHLSTTMILDYLKYMNCRRLEKQFKKLKCCHDKVVETVMSTKFLLIKNLLVFFQLFSWFLTILTFLKVWKDSGSWMLNHHNSQNFYQTGCCFLLHTCMFSQQVY